MTSTGAKHHLKYKVKVSYKPAGKSIKVQMILSVQNLKYSDIVFEHLSLPKLHVIIFMGQSQIMAQTPLRLYLSNYAKVPNLTVVDANAVDSCKMELIVNSIDCK